MPFLRQLFDADTFSFTYLLADVRRGDALLIDPVIDHVERDLHLLRELGLRLRYALDTHVHADHVTGVGALRERTGCTTVAGALGPESSNLRLADGAELTLGSMRIRVLATPGHTDCSVTYVLDDQVFTGDALLVRGCGRTDFQNGDAGQLYDSITSGCSVCPSRRSYGRRTTTRASRSPRSEKRSVGTRVSPGATVPSSSS